MKLRKDPGKGRQGIHDGVAANTMDMLHLLKNVWDDIKPSSIIKCWLKADILCERQTNELKKMVTQRKQHGSVGR